MYIDTIDIYPCRLYPIGSMTLDISSTFPYQFQGVDNEKGET